MKRIETDLAIIGGGPAGLAAALEAKRLGIGRVLLLERDHELGGILQQCIHDGFGIHRFGARLTGGQYAQRFIDELRCADVTVMTGAMVLEVGADTSKKILYATSRDEGMMEIVTDAVILAMGCRERTGMQVQIHGDRPAGVLTAGAVQQYINREGYLPGTRAVILGSGDIGLIMARRMTLEGIEVKAVYEVLPHPSGLTRNVVQCLEDYGIPLHLGATVTQIHGKQRVEAVTVAKVDEHFVPIPGTETRVDCDLLVLAVGLIPENELSRQAGIMLDPRTGGPVLDSDGQTSVPGIFAAGNVAVVFDLVDFVSDSGEIAARGAAKYLSGRLSAQQDTPNTLVEEHLKKPKGSDAPVAKAAGQYTCIVCPNSCLLTVSGAADSLTVEGHRCKRGIDYGRAEHLGPTRLLTTSVRLSGGKNRRLPVVSESEIPRAKLNDCLKILYGLTVSGSVVCGERIVENIGGTGVDIVAARTWEG